MTKTIAEQNLPFVSPSDLRHPDEVMRLGRLGSAFPHRLSFMRVLMRQLSQQSDIHFKIKNQLDDDGYGRMVLGVTLAGRRFSLVAFSRPLAPENRTDRVIATAWDACFCLYDGEPDDATLDWLEGHVPYQEQGHYSDKILTLSRANKSVRLFNKVVELLSDGQQPDKDMLLETGYLMRTTAVYGNGKFGISDRAGTANHTGMDAPFQAEMLTVWLIRAFSFALVSHIAAQRGGDRAVSLSSDARTCLGIGNSTGLGMAPFLMNHPCLIHSWIIARETALARVRLTAGIDRLPQFAKLIGETRRHLAYWQVADDIQSQRITLLKAELATFQAEKLPALQAHDLPFDEVMRSVNDASFEMQELMAALIIELGPEWVDELSHCLSNPHQEKLDPAMSVAALKQLIHHHYQWALDLDLTRAGSDALFWYVSEEKLEPRLGLRHEEPGSELEMPFDIAHQVQHLNQMIKDKENTNAQGARDHLLVAEFVMAHPECRSIVKRIQTIARYPYGEIRDNLVDQSCRPIDLLRAKLSFFGASAFDPKSDRWVRITLFQGAPLAEQFDTEKAKSWYFAHPLPESCSH
ncbi:MAG: hypothetical protein ACON4Q_08885 [Candidatus Puniceispirillaceae bacterium]